MKNSGKYKIELIWRHCTRDKHYDRKHPDTHDRLDSLYDKMSDIDDQLQDVNEKIKMVYESQITSKQVYQIPMCFDKIYFEMTDLKQDCFSVDSGE